MAINYKRRLRQVRARMDARGIEMLVLSRSANLQWVTGMPRHKPGYTYEQYPGAWSMAAYITAKKGPVFVFPRMVAEFDLAHLPDAEVHVLPDRGDPKALLAKLFKSFNLKTKRIAIEDRAWAQAVVNLSAALPGATFGFASDIIAPLRAVKTEDEIDLMRRSARLCDAAMGEVLKKLRPGVSELEILFEVDYQLARAGAEATSFPSALYIHNPRHNERAKGKKGASTHPIEAGTAIPFDFGAVYEGYASDFGRTVWIGEPPAEYRRTFDLVMASQAAGIAAMKSGRITAARLDAVARKVIDKGGYGAHFRHRLGHGIGMDVHEAPFLNTGDDTVLEDGMAFTIEPSIILDGRWMVRVEDVVVVRDGGGEPLSDYSRKLLVAG